MPDLNPNLTALRAGGWQQWYLGAFTGTAVLTGEVTADAADQATSLSYTTSTGAYTAVQRGFLVRVTTAAGLLKAFWRVRASGTLNATTLPITELSQGSVDINTGDLLEVRDVILPGAKVVEADANFRPDGLAAGTYNSALPPMACAGPHRVAPLDSGEAYATVTLYGSLSAAIDADSGGTLTYSWVAATATGTTTSADADAAFTFPIGEHLVVLTATDASNSATWTTYRKVLVYDPSDPTAVLMDVIVESIDSDVENGTSARFQLPGGASLDDLPDGSLVALVCVEYINGTEQSFGNAVAAASNIKALGYLRREDDENNADDGTQTLSFEIISPLQFYRELVTGYSKVLTHNTSADAWDELDDLSFWRMIVQIGRWYTWLTEFHDLVNHSSFDDQDYSSLYLTKSNPIEQMAELARACDGRITCDRTGRFEAQMQPYAIAEGSRSGITTWGTFTDDDRGSFNFERDHWPYGEIVEVRGIIQGTSTATNQPVFSRYPGLAPGLGLQSHVVEGLVVDSQADLNTRAGPLAEWLLGKYFTSAGVMHPALNGEVAFPGSYFVFDPAYCEYLLLDLDGDTNLRGIDLNDHRFIVQRVSYTPDEQGTGEVRVGFRTATNGPAGQTYVPPSEESNGLPPWTPPSYDFGPWTPPAAFPDPNALTTGMQSLFAINDDGYWYRCGPDLTGRGFDTPAASGGPIWARGALGASGTYQMAALEPFSVGSGSTDGVFCTTTGIYKIEDTGGASPSVALLHTFANAASVAFIETSIASQGWILAIYYRSSATNPGTFAVYSTDGATFAEVQISTFRQTLGSVTVRPALYMSIYTAGVAYAQAFSSDNVAALYKTTDYGANWSAVSTGTLNVDPGLTLTGTLHFPWHNNASENIVYYGRRTSDPNEPNQMYRATGGTATLITPTYLGHDYGPRFPRQVATGNGDQNTVVAIPTNFEGTGERAIFKSRDAGATWTLVEHLTDYVYSHVPDDRNVVYLWGGPGGYFGYSNDFLVAVDDRSGNIPTDFPAAGTFINVWGL